MGISSVGSFPVWSGGSLIFFPVPRHRNLALNRVFFLLFLVIGMFFILWGHLDALYVCTSLYICMPPVCLYP